MKGFDSFTAIDIETTGLDPSLNEIIELGAVRYADGERVDQMSILVKPTTRISPEITRLTGISNQMVESCQGLDEVLESFIGFVEEGPWIVGHNVAFDLGFLKKRLEKKRFGILEARTLDTAILSRALFPRLARYSLPSLVAQFDVSRKRGHRALDDSLATAEIYIKLLGHLAALSPAARESLGRLLLGADFIDLFRKSISAVNPKVILRKAGEVSIIPGEPEVAEAGELYPDNVMGETPPQKQEDYVRIDAVAVENHFLPGGILAKRIPSYEYRPQQAEMAMKVAEAFNQSLFLLCEAPTGVGKSLAYLLPASWWASLNRERVVVSTQTKSLQAQLFYKDLPQIQVAVGYQFKATLLKGKGNYICLYKYHELLAEAEVAFDKRDRESLSALTLWVKNSRTGDISECNGFNPSHNHYIWSRISCEGSFCLGQGCVFADRCFLLKVRREALSSQLVVTNHHLTFADFVSGGEIAIGAGNIVFDEAHNLEKVAASYLGNVIDKRTLDGSLAGMYSSRPRQSGFLISLKIGLASERPGDELIDTVERVIDAISNLNHASARFFEALSLKIQALSSSSEAREIAYTSGANPCAIDERDELISSIDGLLEKIETLIANLREGNSIAKRRDAVIRLEAFFSDLRSFRGQAEDVLYASSPDYVYWIEKPSSPRYSPRLLSAPLDVGNLLDKRFYDHLKTVVFSSATLSVNRNFDYITQRLGLDLDSKDRLSSICLDSPFDIDAQVAVISAGYLPSPKRPEFDQAANQSLSDILLAGARKAMVLFTSYRSLQNSIQMLSKTIENAGMELFHQEGSFSSERVFRRFKSSKKAVLFGTDTFWEGVDLPGELLELLVLFKFPFTVPDRPWFKANLERIERGGESSFAKLSLPEAVVKFRQGFGRLIRTASDRGCVVILDSRVETTSFGPIFLNSVRGEKFRARSSDEIAALIRSWLG